MNFHLHNFKVQLSLQSFKKAVDAALSNASSNNLTVACHSIVSIEKNLQHFSLCSH